MVPGRRFSTAMSARSIKRRNTALPRGSLRSRARERLLRLSRMKLEDSPSRNGAVARTWSPPSGFSIFTTSAPRSASWSVQNGAAMKLPTSTTRTPASADSDMALIYTGAPRKHHPDSAGRSRSDGDTPGQLPHRNPLHDLPAFHLDDGYVVGRPVRGVQA